MSSVVAVNEIERTVEAALPGISPATLSSLARILADVACDPLHPPEVQARIAAEPSLALLLSELAGKTLQAGEAAISFGSGNRFDRKVSDTM